MTEAKLLIQNSDYSSEPHDELLRDAFVFAADSDNVRKKCIAEGNDLTLKKAREIARTDKATKLQPHAMSNETDMQVNSLHRPRGYIKTKQRSQRDNRANCKQRHNKLCNPCGSEPHTSDKKCPVSGAECHYCLKRGHFSKVCQKRNQVHGIQNHIASKQENNYNLKNDDMFLGSLEIDNLNNNDNRNKVEITVDVTAKPYHKKTTPIVCKIDTKARSTLHSNRCARTVHARIKIM